MNCLREARCDSLRSSDLEGTDGQMQQRPDSFKSSRLTSTPTAIRANAPTSGSRAVVSTTAIKSGIFAVLTRGAKSTPQIAVLHQTCRLDQPREPMPIYTVQDNIGPAGCPDSSFEPFRSKRRSPHQTPSFWFTTPAVTPFQ
jgi:hypothetical protein